MSQLQPLPESYNCIMDLFEQLDKQLHNLLPIDGEVYYHGPVLSVVDANQYFYELMHDIAWQHDEVVVYGKKIVTRRKVAWYADQAFSYTYSNVTKTAKPWIPILLQLRAFVETQSGESYNACLLNLYNDGEDGMAWHSDAEKDLKANAAIASLSFGAQRNFCFKHKKTKETISRVLEHGSLLVMKGATQTHWLHSLPTSKSVHTPRINLTFRTVEKN